MNLLVTDNGRSWVFRFTSPVTGKVREMGLGRAGTGGVSLAAARAERDRLRAKLRDGVDPLEARRHTREAQRRRAAEDEARKTVREAAEAYVAQKEREWGSKLAR